jgi:DegV family protein with EDD domain
VGNVRIVTDSSASFAPGLREKYAIEVIPHTIKIGRERYLEDGSFTVDELFHKVREHQNGGEVAAPEVQAAELNRILDCLHRVGRTSEQIVAIHTSSHLSPMWAQSRRAAEMMMGRYTIRVIDSLSTSLGLGVLVELAAKAAYDGASVHEVARIVNGAVPHLYATFFSETLSYLERSAHLGVSQSILGTMLGIKAMLTMEDGQLMPLEKVQDREQVVDKLYEFIVEFSHIEEVGIIQHRYEQPEEHLLQRLKEGLPNLRVRSIPYSPSLATHLGANVMGVLVYEGVG